MVNRYANLLTTPAPRTIVFLCFPQNRLRYFFLKTAFALYFFPKPFCALYIQALCAAFPSARALTHAGGKPSEHPNGFPYIPARLRQTRLPMMAAAPVTATRASTAAANTPRSAVDGVDVSDDAALDSSSPARLPNARISET